MTIINIMRPLLVIFITLWLPLLNIQAAAQTNGDAPSPTKRSRIGLVLEGGGALGLAHIGVLEWIEKNHIPVDYIAGTSMGGLVAGLYASGKSPAEIRKLTTEIDWDQVLKGQVTFQDLSYRRKEDKIAFPNRLELGLHAGLSLPGGLNSGQEVGMILDRALLPYYEMRSFDDLPIPFRCVATDLNSGQKKVFDKGLLSLALRATMSIPAVFAPVRIDGHLYTDGGAVDNLPVDVAKDMGADIIIAVYLDTGPPDPKTFNTLLGAAARNIGIMVAANELQSIKKADILVSADVKDFTATDFKLGDQISPKGYEAAEQKKSVLSKLAVSPEEWDLYIAARAKRIRVAVPVPQFISVTGVGPRDAKPIESDLKRFAGKPLDAPEFEASLTRLTGYGYFSSLNYGLIDRAGVSGIEVRAQDKGYGPPFLHLNVVIDGSDTANVLFGLGARLTLLNLGGFLSEWRTDAFFGTGYGISTEYFRPLSETSKWFTAARAYAQTTPFDIYADNDRISEYNLRRLGMGIDLGYSLSARSEVRLEQDLASYGTKRVTGVVLGPDSTKTIGITSMKYTYFGQDNVVLPRSGYQNQTSVQRFSTGPNGGSYKSAETRNGYFKKVTRKTSALVRADGGTTFGARNLDLQSFSLGGPFRLGAYGRHELLGNQYFLVQTGFSYELFRLNPLIGTNLSAVAFYEVGKIYGNRLAPKLPNDATGAVVLRTAFGPFFLGGSVGDSGRRRWWFGMGRVF